MPFQGDRIDPIQEIQAKVSTTRMGLRALVIITRINSSVETSARLSPPNEPLEHC
jgi:hypothetical protein